MKDYIRHQRGRMYENNFFEFFSKVHPAVPFVFWIPAASFILGRALYQGTTTWQASAAMLPVGFMTWVLLEYFIHKGLFHTFPGWTGHGFHHKYPDDDTRLVMPLPVSIGLAAIVAGLLWFVGRPDITIPCWVGIVVGYLWYDFTHWSLHNREPMTGWGKQLRAHHLAHHFGHHDANFGISHMWVDKMLNTTHTRDKK